MKRPSRISSIFRSSIPFTAGLPPSQLYLTTFLPTLKMLRYRNLCKTIFQILPWQDSHLIEYTPCRDAPRIIAIPTFSVTNESTSTLSFLYMPKHELMMFFRLYIEFIQLFASILYSLSSVISYKSYRRV